MVKDGPTPPAPALSVVVVPFGGAGALARCLAALARQTAAGDLEVVLPWADSLGDPDELGRRFPGPRIERVAGRATWAALRAAGIRASRAPVVAVTEAQCVPEAGWAAAALAAHRARPAAIGGVVDRRGGPIVGWAMYFLDYARYAPPRPTGPAAALTDCNVSYKRQALAAVGEVWADEFHENEVHAALARRGEKLWLTPAMAVRHARAPRFGEALTDRYRFGRLFAATRAATVDRRRRWLLAAAAPLVPALVVARGVAPALGRPRLLAPLVAALPAMVVLAAVWAAGELVGTVTGRAAQTEAKTAPPADGSGP